MSIRMKCRGCGQVVTLKSRQAGAAVRCPECRELIPAPSGDDGDDDGSGDYSVARSRSKSAKGAGDEFPRTVPRSLAHGQRSKKSKGGVPGWLFVLGAAVVVGLLMMAFSSNDVKDEAIAFRAEQGGAPPALVSDVAAVEAPPATPAAAAVAERSRSSPEAAPQSATPKDDAGSDAPAKSTPPSAPPAPPPRGVMPGLGGHPTAGTPPQPSAAAQAAANATPARGTPTETYGGTGGIPFEAVSPDGPLLGLRYAVGPWTGELVISRLEPVFNRAVPKDGLKPVVARRGFAVGAVEVDAGNLVNALRIVFMAIDADGQLDPKKTYKSEWLGRPTRRKPRMLNAEGATVIGIHGTRAAVLDSIGLVVD